MATTDFYMDGFEFYTSAADFALRYSSYYAPSLTFPATGRSGTKCFHSTDSNANFVRSFPATSVISMLIAFRPSANGAGNAMFHFDSMHGGQGEVYFLSNGTLKAANGSNSNFGTSGTVAVGQWNTLELQWKMDAVAGYVKCRLNGVQFANFAGNTKVDGNYNTTSSIQVHSGNVQIDFDDFFLAAAGAKSLDYIGDRHVFPIAIVAPGAVTQLSRGGSSPAATNWQSVLTQDGDTSFVYGATPGNYDLYALDNPGVAGDLFAIQATSVVRKDDATTRVFHHVLRSAGTTTDTDGADQGLALGYAAVSDSWVVDPVSGLPFTSLTLPQIGPKVAV